MMKTVIIFDVNENIFIIFLSFAILEGFSFLKDNLSKLSS